MNRLAIKLFLKRWRNIVFLAADGFYDALRFARHSHLGGRLRTAVEYHGVMTMEYHRLEKGLTLPNPRPYFGVPVVGKVLDLLRRHPEYAGERATAHGIESVRSYFRVHEERGAVQPAAQSPTLTGYRHRADALASLVGSTEWIPAGITEVEGAAIVEAGQGIDFDRFMRSRHSTRNFTDRPVETDALLQAVDLALRSPSVCNRQSWQCHFTTDPDVMSRALECQNGNAGFRSTIPAMCIITGKLGYFVSPSERNQGWIDGGLFSMSLILALHSLGLATCCLNWSADFWTDRKLRKAVRLPDDENVIMMLAIGHPLDRYSVCVSPRRPASDVLKELVS